MVYKPQGVCSQLINVELDGDVIKSVEFVGGCAGNTMGISQLVKGMKVDDAIQRMEGTPVASSPLPARINWQKR